MAVWIPAAALTWLGVGALVAVPFLLFGVGRVVDGAAGSSLAFRLIVLPGAVLLWPVVLRRWAASRASGGRS